MAINLLLVPATTCMCHSMGAPIHPSIHAYIPSYRQWAGTRTEADRHTDRQRDRRTDRDRQADRQTDRQTETDRDRRRRTETDGDRQRQTETD